MEDRPLQLLSAIDLLCSDAQPVYQAIQQSLYRHDGVELQRWLRNLDNLLAQLNAHEKQLETLLDLDGSQVTLQTAWANFLLRQPNAEQSILRQRWSQTRANLSLLHSKLRGLQLQVDLRRQLLHNFVVSMQKVDESVNYDASGRIQGQQGSGAMLNRQV